MSGWGRPLVFCCGVLPLKPCLYPAVTYSVCLQGCGAGHHPVEPDLFRFALSLLPLPLVTGWALGFGLGGCWCLRWPLVGLCSFAMPLLAFLPPSLFLLPPLSFYISCLPPSPQGRWVAPASLRFWIAGFCCRRIFLFTHRLDIAGRNNLVARCLVLGRSGRR